AIAFATCEVALPTIVLATNEWHRSAGVARADGHACGRQQAPAEPRRTAKAGPATARVAVLRFANCEIVANDSSRWTEAIGRLADCAPYPSQRSSGAYPIR